MFSHWAIFLYSFSVGFHRWWLASTSTRQLNHSKRAYFDCVNDMTMDAASTCTDTYPKTADWGEYVQHIWYGLSVFKINGWKRWGRERVQVRVVSVLWSILRFISNHLPKYGNTIPKTILLSWIDFWHFLSTYCQQCISMANIIIHI